MYDTENRTNRESVLQPDSLIRSIFIVLYIF